MKLFPVSTDPRVSNERLSENGLVRLWVAAVLHGYRVQAGFHHDRFGFELDWCAGEQWKSVIQLYALAHAILLGRPEDQDCFRGLPPTSRVKPFYNDVEFVGRIYQAAIESAASIRLIPLEQPRADRVKAQVCGNDP